MLGKLKQHLYFPVAYYFYIFAKIRLMLWKPTIVLVTGSNGKTTLLHLIQAQLGDIARYSHHANSAYGIPFDILGIHRETLKKAEWLRILFQVPLGMIKPIPREQVYIVEADADRPYEATFLGRLLKPHYTIWLSSAKTHSMNFDHLVLKNTFESPEEAVAYEFGTFLTYTQKAAYINADNTQIVKQSLRTNTTVVSLRKSDCSEYAISNNGTLFVIHGQRYFIPYLMPEVTCQAVDAAIRVSLLFGSNIDASFTRFTLPPGRSSLLKGIKDILIIDSSYNANVKSMEAILTLFKHLDAYSKWMIIGSMREQGSQEQTEHERLADLIIDAQPDRIILMEEPTKHYTLPKLQQHLDPSIPVVYFENPDEVLAYLQKEIVGSETILFKGGRFLEGVIEHLLADPADVIKLCRQEEVWRERRRNAGL